MVDVTAYIRHDMKTYTLPERPAASMLNKVKRLDKLAADSNTNNDIRMDTIEDVATQYVANEYSSGTIYLLQFPDARCYFIMCPSDESKTCQVPLADYCLEGRATSKDESEQSIFTAANNAIRGFLKYFL